MTEAKLVILRHGEASDYIERQANGQMDVPLSEAGEVQARVAGQLIRDIPFSAAYSSPLLRACSTAALALEAAGQEISVEPRAEIIENEAENCTRLSLKGEFDSANILNRYIYDAVPLVGESCKQVVARVQKFYDEEVQPRLARGENVIVVTHAGVIRAFDIVLGLVPTPADGAMKPKGRSVPNAAPAVHEYKDGVLKKSYDIANPETAKADEEFSARLKNALERVGKQIPKL